MTVWNIKLKVVKMTVLNIKLKVVKMTAFRSVDCFWALVYHDHIDCPN